ncbi:MAG: hypothetical protein QM651_13735 [Rhodoblastus sp.]
MKYVYSGPPHAAEIFPIASSEAPKEGEAPKAVEPLVSGWLVAGAEVALPEDHPVAVAWKARRWLTPVEAKEEPAADKPAEKPADKPATPPPYTPPTATGAGGQTNS